MFISFLLLSAFFWLGAVTGNFLTSFFFRVPRFIPLNGLERPPSCSFCGARLKYPAYTPFYSFFIGFKAKCCHAKIPVVYTMIELFTGVFSVIFFKTQGFSALNVSKFFFIIFFFLISLIFFYHKRIYEKLNWILFTFALTYGFLKSGSISEMLSVARVFVVISLILALKFSKKTLHIEEILLFFLLAFIMHPVYFIISFSFSLLMSKVESIEGIKLMPFCIFLLFL